jgi:hypothetical protein
LAPDGALLADSSAGGQLAEPDTRY